MDEALLDSNGRRFEYLRLSLTDVCNFRCSYFLPQGHRRLVGQPANLLVEEIRRLVAVTRLETIIQAEREAATTWQRSLGCSDTCIGALRHRQFGLQIRTPDICNRQFTDHRIDIGGQGVLQPL